MDLPVIDLDLFLSNPESEEAALECKKVSPSMAIVDLA